VIELALSIYINKHTKKLIILISVSVLAALMTAFLIYASVFYRSEVNVAEITNVTVEKVNENYYLTPEEDFEIGIIFYPGNKIAAESYLPFLSRFAELGILVVVVDMPYHLTLFGKNKAASIIASYPSVDFYIMGHAEGGEAAARYASKNPDLVKGLILLASYSKYEVSVPALSIYGTLDTVMDMDEYDANEANLVSSTTIPLIGGNHSMYGDYGLQKGDTETTLTITTLRTEIEVAVRAFIALTA